VSRGEYLGIGADGLVLCAVNSRDFDFVVVLEAFRHLLPRGRKALAVTAPGGEVLHEVHLAVTDLRTERRVQVRERDCDTASDILPTRHTSPLSGP
jgi:hypothetical protein